LSTISINQSIERHFHSQRVIQ